ncbi:MAG TPA: hypothetical protein VF179_25750 [Thermoanaerobaculia bacterium]|nr:hypothetical protein [Thermoanaerobaculia bacterium]
MRYSALIFILLAAFIIPAEAAQPVAVVLSQPVEASEIEPRPGGIARHGASLLQIRAKQLAALVQQRLLDSYAQRHGLEPTEAELRALLRSFEEAAKGAEESMKRAKEERIAGIRKKLEAPALDPAERTRLTAELANWERSPTGRDAKAREADPMISALAQNWKVQRSLYRQYGGRVLLSSFGFHVAIDAMRQFLQEEEKRGSFEIPDPDLRAAFWAAVADETWADGVTSGRGAEDVFATPPWQAEERRP